jgi:hypothetical protein
VRKWFNIRSKAHDFHADDVAAIGRTGRHFCEFACVRLYCICGPDCSPLLQQWARRVSLCLLKISFVVSSASHLSCLVSLFSPDTQFSCFSEFLLPSYWWSAFSKKNYWWSGLLSWIGCCLIDGFLLQLQEGAIMSGGAAASPVGSLAQWRRARQVSRLPKAWSLFAIWTATFLNYFFNATPRWFREAVEEEQWALEAGKDWPWCRRSYSDIGL